METLGPDLRHWVRMLAKSPGFTAMAVLTLALGLGANTAIFSIVNSLLLRPFPFPNLDRLVSIWETGGAEQSQEKWIAPADFIDLRSETRSFEGFAAYRFRNLNLSVDGEVEGTFGVVASPNFFEILGAQPALGRTFRTEEEQEDRDEVVVLSDAFWRRRFGGDPNALGKTLQINGRSFTVVGVMPPSFDFPPAMPLWMPLALGQEEKTQRDSRTFYVLGRLRPGVSLNQARQELQSFAARLERQFPKTNTGRSMALLPLRRYQYKYTAPLFLMLQAAAGFLLLLACANLVNLLFARMIERQKEIAIREALGARRKHLARLFLSETMLLSLLAATVAVLVSLWGVDVIRSSMPVGISKWVAGWSDIRVDRNVLGFTLLLTTLLGIAFGFGTIFHSSRVDLNQMLKEGGRSATAGFRRNRLRQVLVVTQVVLAMVLLVGAGLIVKGFLHLADIYSELQPNNVLTLQLAVPKQRYPEDQKAGAFYQQVLRGIASLPGVESASLVTNLPASNVDNYRTAFTIEGQPALRSSDLPSADMQSTSADFFRTLRIPVLQGRSLSDQDGPDSPRVALVSRSMAQRFWPRGNVLGQRLKMGDPESQAPWVTIVGVVGDVKQNWWEPVPRPTLYLPYLQAPQRSFDFAVRTASDPMSIVGAIRGLVRQIDPQIPLSSIQPMEGFVADALAPIHIIGILMMAFGAAALILSAVGVYGVLAHSVAQRTHEFGVRMALGARPSDVLRMVLGQALRLCGMGLAVSVPVAFVLSRTMKSLLYGVVALDAGVLLGFAFLLIFVSLAAGYVPAWRAMRVDPMVALRYE